MKVIRPIIAVSFGSEEKLYFFKIVLIYFSFILTVKENKYKFKDNKICSDTACSEYYYLHIAKI